jgi:hypothetical protein
MKQQRRMNTVFSSLLGRGKHRQNLEGGQNQRLTLFSRKLRSMMRRIAGNLSHQRSDMLPQSPRTLSSLCLPAPTLFPSLTGSLSRSFSDRQQVATGGDHFRRLPQVLLSFDQSLAGNPSCPPLSNLSLNAYSYS